jgi:anti-sigma B factor antagonist
MEKASAAFQIEKEILAADGAVIVCVTGDLDAHTSKLLQAAIIEVYKSGCYKVAVDLTNVNYMSSAGAGLFIVAQAEAQENSGDLVLLSATAAVRYVLDLLGLTPQFHMADTRAAALAILKSCPAK